jgi:hypothetical protein
LDQCLVISPYRCSPFNFFPKYAGDVVTEAAEVVVAAEAIVVADAVVVVEVSVAPVVVSAT